jgi:RNA polymerase sigma factor (sigma-70 family)
MIILLNGCRNPMNMTEHEDTNLIQNILNGNPVAQETVYKKYRKIVKNYILSKFPPYYDLEDDVSEIMIKVFLNLKEYDSNKSKFKSWVISITKNYLIDKWRTGTGTITVSANNIIFNTDNPYCNTTCTNGMPNANNLITFTSTNNASCCFENCNAVGFVSAQLSAVDFTMLDMKYVQGYDYKEIGSEFQLTSSTVSNKINYIKTKLKKNLPEDIFE